MNARGANRSDKRARRWLSAAAFVLLITASESAFAETVAYFADKLGDTDFRVRTQAALALGKSDDDAAVAPLCGAINDANEVVRAAVAAGLGKLGRASGSDCLNARMATETDAGVKTQLDKAIKKISGGNGGNIPANAKVYVALGPTNNKSSRAGDEVNKVVSDALTGKLGTMRGYAIAPKGENASAAKAIVAAKKLKGFQLQTTVDAPVYEGDKLTIVVHMVLVTYPGKDIKGSVSPKLSQSGTSPDDKDSEYALIKMACEQALDNFDKVVAAL